VQRALPEADVIVHVEPQRPEEVEVRERAQEAALRVPDVREVHNVNVLNVDGRTEISLHLKLPGALSLGAAHAVAEQVERTILDAVPEATAVRTHLEPLAETSEGRRPSEREVEGHMEAVLRIVKDELGAPPRALRMLETGDGLVLFLTLALDPHTELAAAHEKASAVEERIRRERPDVADVHVHTEP
jgi:divalent metal cation (Fe/Co/Zn/Cd) transporter